MDNFIAIDWGTTNRRIYRIENGEVVATVRDDLGALAFQPDRYTVEIAAIRARFGNLPVLLAGMVGSTAGWQIAPYVDLPAGIRELAASLTWVADDVAIVPGVAQRDPADVMRGEEVQLLGAAASKMVPQDALLCQPGTHCKWADLRKGKIAGFTTAMTGELFRLLQEHSILAEQIGSPVEDNTSFREGVRRGASAGLQTELFRIRARAVLDGDREAASFASGLLIGDDVARHVGREEVFVLADGPLAELYCAAVAELGATAHQVDSHAAFVAGIVEIGRALP